MNKRSISLILMIVFSLSIVLNTAQPSLASSTDQADALNAYYQILSSFEWKSGKPVYPDDYGGEYIDGSLLYVWIVHKNPISQRKYEQLCEGSEYVRFLDAAYSLNELEKLADDLMVSGKDYNISGHYVDRVNNRLCICIAPNGYETSKSEYAGFSYEKTVNALTLIWREYLDRIVFCEQEYLDYSNDESDDVELAESPSNTRNTDLIGGIGIIVADDVNNGTSSGTLGFCGTYNLGDNSYCNAVLTAGHVMYEAQIPYHNDLSLYYTGIAPWYKFATCDFYKFGNYEYENGNGDDINNSDGDFAICKKPQNTYNLTNKVKFSTGTINITGTILGGWQPVGAYVSCYGNVTQYHLGIVSALNVSHVSGLGVTISGLVMVNMLGNNICHGDSGGPVYTCIESISGTYGMAEGTICAKAPDIMYYSPISYAMSRGFVIMTS